MDRDIHWPASIIGQVIDHQPPINHQSEAPKTEEAITHHAITQRSLLQANRMYIF
jgi:hypothetical protein